MNFSLMLLRSNWQNCINTRGIKLNYFVFFISLLLFCRINVCLIFSALCVVSPAFAHLFQKGGLCKMTDFLSFV